MKTLTLSFLLCLSFTLSFGQHHPYTFAPNLEMTILGIGGGLTASGFVLERTTPRLTEQEIMLLNIQDINPFDRSATDYWSPSRARVSDGLLIGSFALPLIFLADKRTRSHFPLLFGFQLETFFANQGLTSMTKALSRRTRPFVYRSDVDLHIKQERDARFAFYSGHTSHVAAMSFFTAKVFHDYHPKSKARPFVWMGCAALPAVTGYLRYRSGKHYPSDVIMGYVTGAITGFLIPHLHKKRKRKGRIKSGHHVSFE